MTNMTAAATFDAALATARRTGTAAAYREAAKWALAAANEAPYGQKEPFWAQHDACTAIAEAPITAADLLARARAQGVAAIDCPPRRGWPTKILLASLGLDVADPAAAGHRNTRAVRRCVDAFNARCSRG